VEATLSDDSLIGGKSLQSYEKEEMILCLMPLHLEIEQYLRGVQYPAKKNDLINHARQLGASQDMLETLTNLRERIFNSPADVSRAVGEMGIASTPRRPLTLP